MGIRCDFSFYIWLLFTFKFRYVKLKFICFQTCMLWKIRELGLISTQTDPIELNIVVEQVQENKSV